MTVSPQPAPGDVVVLGTGAMAPEIAVAVASAGLPTRIAGRDPGRAEAAARWARGFAGTTVDSAGIEPAAFSGAAVVIETVVEDADVKRDLLARVEPWCPAACVIATNTSSLTIADLAGALQRPEWFAGLHFLKPAHLTGVVEVIPGPATGVEAVVTLRALATAIGKTPLTVGRDVPGFIWNRIQFAVLRECLHMLDEGVADAADIDAAVADGLAPRWIAAGPLATADLGGLGTFRRVCEQLFPHLASGHDVSAQMLLREASGEPFASWTRADPDAVARLREHALEAGRRVAAERRALEG